MLLAVVGPGFITASVDNDAGGICDLFGRRGAVRLLAALDVHPDRPSRSSWCRKCRHAWAR